MSCREEHSLDQCNLVLDCTSCARNDDAVGYIATASAFSRVLCGVQLKSLNAQATSNMIWAIGVLQVKSLGFGGQKSPLAVLELRLVESGALLCCRQCLCCYLSAGYSLFTACLQATHLSCFQKLIDHLGTMDIQDVDIVQLHQLFQVQVPQLALFCRIVPCPSRHSHVCLSSHDARNLSRWRPASNAHDDQS